MPFGVHHFPDTNITYTPRFIGIQRSAVPFGVHNFPDCHIVSGMVTEGQNSNR
jgi:hypothetical protein